MSYRSTYVHTRKFATLQPHAEEWLEAGPPCGSGAPHRIDSVRVPPVQKKPPPIRLLSVSFIISLLTTALLAILYLWPDRPQCHGQDRVPGTHLPDRGIAYYPRRLRLCEQSRYRQRHRLAQLHHEQRVPCERAAWKGGPRQLCLDPRDRHLGLRRAHGNGGPTSPLRWS